MAPCIAVAIPAGVVVMVEERKNREEDVYRKVLWPRTNEKTRRK
jgi:hypothetical protein